MTTRIEKLTPKQVAQLATVRDEWMTHGLATGPADRTAAEQGVRMAYEAAGLAAPKIVIWLASPLAGAIGAEFLRVMPKEIAGDQVWDQVRAQVWDQVWDQVGDQVWDQVGDQVRDQVWDQVRDQVGDQVGDQVWDQVWDQVRDQVWDQVRDQVGDQVWDQVWDQVRDQVNRAIWGQHDAGWLAFYNYFRDACELAVCRKLDGLSLVAKHSGWWWPFNGAVILTERPTQLHRDEGGRLHSETTAALRYPDGWGIWAIHGVHVPQYVIEEPGSITVEKIHDEKNAEVRRIMVERFGLAKYVKAAKFDVLHTDVDPVGQPRRLLRRDNLVVVELVNSTEDHDGSRRTYHVPCHPELRPLLPDGELGAPQEMTCLAAVASTYGMRASEYRLAVET